MVLAFTPSTDSATGSPRDSVSISGRQALTVTFKEPVIALGSDFGGGVPEEMNPFEIQPAVAGRVRWVTTTIARFDPDNDWPPELELTVSIKTTVQTFSSFELDEPFSRAFTTPALSMYISSVKSLQAMALTNNTWSSGTAPLSVALQSQEVPPDGEVW